VLARSAEDLFRSRCRRTLGSVERVDHLAGPGVVQAFSRLALDRVGIVFKVLHVLFEPVIFLLQGVDLLMKVAILCALLLISVQTIAAHHHVVTEDKRQYNRQRGSDAPPHTIEEIRRARLQLQLWLAGAHSE